MSRFDGTGPRGKGPMTGRGKGLCALKAKKVTLSKAKLPKLYR